MDHSDAYKSYLSSPFRSIKHSTYFESYDHFFSEYRGRDITFVEIGVLGGGSLFMWRDYFGPRARIIGVDLNPGARKWEEHGFEIFIGSQSDRSFWSEFKAEVGGIDVILDDGGHTYEQQVTTTECLIEALNDGGILVVEDTHTSYMRGFGPRKYSFMAYVYGRMDAINQRFGKFSSPRAERRIWSVEVVESMVAFRRRAAASERPSQPTDNGGADDAAVDFRHADNGGRTGRAVRRILDGLNIKPGAWTRRYFR